MEQTKSKSAKSSPQKGGIFIIRSKEKTAKFLQNLVTKANKKDFGRKVKQDAILLRALSLIDDTHIAEIQTASLTNADRLEMAFREHVRKYGAVSKDEFLGLLLQSKEARDGQNCPEKGTQNQGAKSH